MNPIQDTLHHQCINVYAIAMFDSQSQDKSVISGVQQLIDTAQIRQISTNIVK